jgi:signal transduction histidine kinase
MTARRWRLPALSLNPWSFVILAALLTVLAVTAAVLIIDRAGENIVAKQERTALLDRQAELVELDRQDGRDALIADIARRDQLRDRGNRSGLYSADRIRLAGALPLPAKTADNAVYGLAPDEADDFAALEVSTAVLPDGAMLVIGRDKAVQTELRRAILRASGIAIALVVLASMVAGVLLNGRMLRRALGIARIADRIATGDLSARVAVTDPRDPFDRIGYAFNEMLEHIEELMTGMRTVTDSLAHDLRSPLTRLRGALAQAMAADADATQRQRALERAYAEADGALKTISALLDIARAETGLSVEAMQPVELQAVLADMTELFTPCLEDAGQQLVLCAAAAPIVVEAHEPLLRQAIGNLLYNAAQYAGAGSRVTLAATGAGGVASITVADNGIGIPLDQHGRVQERFVRLDAARSTAGSGLGLAIVAACAKLHHGRLVLTDNAPGLRAVLELGPVTGVGAEAAATVAAQN